MKQRTALERYRREVAAYLPAPRQERLEGFARSLAPFLEEVPNPSYEDLTQAFGPPMDMARLLVGPEESLLDPAAQARHRRGWMVAGVLLLALLVGGWGIWRHNAPEEGLAWAGPVTMPESAPAHYYLVDEVFTGGGSQWKQPRGMDYYVEVKNTGQWETYVSIAYSEIAPAHTFVVPGGETQWFYVSGPALGVHTVGFSTPDGALSGHIRVLVAEEDWRP